MQDTVNLVVKITMMMCDGYKSDFARKDKLYPGNEKSPKDIEVSYGNDSGEMQKGAVPKKYLLSSSGKRLFLLPKK